MSDKITKAALVTGGGIRIGKAIALALANSGYDIALHYSRSKEAAFETQAQIEAIGQKCKLYCEDFSNIASGQALIEQVSDDMDGLSVLINSASVFNEVDFIDTDVMLLQDTFAINFFAPFMLTQAFAKVVDTKGQSPIAINILDTRIRKNQTEHFGYTLTKKCLADFTQMAAKALAPKIRVCAVAPGYILPPVNQSKPVKQGNAVDRIAARIPLAKQGKLSDVTDAVRYLVDHDFVTGEILFADGGENL